MGSVWFAELTWAWVDGVFTTGASLLVFYTLPPQTSQSFLKRASRQTRNHHRPIVTHRFLCGSVLAQTRRKRGYQQLLSSQGQAPLYGLSIILSQFNSGIELDKFTRCLRVNTLSIHSLVNSRWRKGESGPYQANDLSETISCMGSCEKHITLGGGLLCRSACAPESQYQAWWELAVSSRRVSHGNVDGILQRCHRLSFHQSLVFYAIITSQTTNLDLDINSLNICSGPEDAIAQGIQGPR